jgi:hypothetical protein
MGGNGTADDRLFVLNSLSLLWHYVPTTAPRPSGRDDAVLGQFNTALFMQGGREGESGVLVEGNTWVLSGGAWSSSSSGPGQRWGASGCVLPQSPEVFVMFGGVAIG